MINFRIKIKISIFLNFFIEPPPPITERDEPNNTLMTFLYTHYTTKLYKPLICFKVLFHL